MWLLILLLLAVVFIIIATTKLNLHPFLALLIAAFGYGILSGKNTRRQITIPTVTDHKHDHRIFNLR